MLPAERIDHAILTVRGQRVMLDADLAALYGVSTKRLNEQVRRNAARFPADFMFRLTAAEKSDSGAQMTWRLSDAGTEACATDATGGAGLRAGRDAGAKSSEPRYEVVAKCDHLHRLKFSPVLPGAFTEHGAVMLASVLNTPIAVEASVLVVRAFVRIRHLLAGESQILQRLEALEAHAETTDVQLALVFEELKEIRAIMDAPITLAIGFRTDA
ncbi:MAG: ORF6N domain-containing protein [Candidatus Sericytochromatia bacterium]|nr:ORF6N domain-containing protein [Candidatus Tanganyikabacteria bacterium]